MPRRVSEKLDVRDGRQVEAYERAFHTGFVRATHNQLVRSLWEWDDHRQRLRTRVPYADQEIWVVRAPADRAARADVGGPAPIVAGVAVNVALHQLQAAAYGFALPPDLADAKAARVCEFLTFFATDEHSLAGKRALWRELFDDLRRGGFRHAVATCSPKVYALYRWMGAVRIGQVEFSRETRYFLRFDLDRTERSIG